MLEDTDIALLQGIWVEPIFKGQTGAYLTAAEVFKNDWPGRDVNPIDVNTCLSVAMCAMTGSPIFDDLLDVGRFSIFACQSSACDYMFAQTFTGQCKMPLYGFVPYCLENGELKWSVQTKVETWAPRDIVSVQENSMAFNVLLCQAIPKASLCLLHLYRVPFMTNRCKASSHAIACRLMDSGTGLLWHVSINGEKFMPSHTRGAPFNEQLAAAFHGVYKADIYTP